MKDERGRRIPTSGPNEILTRRRPVEDFSGQSAAYSTLRASRVKKAVRDTSSRTSHGCGIARDECPQRPGNRLLHHVVTIGGKAPADRQRASRVSPPAVAAHVERDCADNCRPPQPSITGARPLRDQCVADVTVCPRRARQNPREGIDAVPPIEPSSKLRDCAIVQRGESRGMIANQLAADPAIPAR